VVQHIRGCALALRLRILAVTALLLAPEYAWAALPAFRALGTFASGTTSCAPGLPAGHTANDILVLTVESDDTADVTANESYVSIGRSTSGTDVSFEVFVKRHDGSEVAPTVSSAVDHCHAWIAAYSGVTTGADFFEIGAFASTASLTITYTGITTETADALVLLLTAIGDNANDSENLTTYTNANLSSLTDRDDEAETTGTGGGLGFADGGNATADAIGDSTSAHDNAVDSVAVHLALYSIEPSAPTCTAGLNLPLLGVGGCP
jgi:hypothetical protein